MTRFDKTWRQASRLVLCSISELDEFIKAHYLRKRPAVVVLAMKVEVGSMAVGAVVFALPPREADKRYGGRTWELARLYLHDFVPSNAETWVIGQAVGYIKRNFPEVKFLLSYADPSAGHRGTIYKAANWLPDGKTDDERKSARCDYVDERTGKKYGRRGNVPEGAIVVRKPRVSKWRFYLPLDRSKLNPQTVGKKHRHLYHT